MRKKKIAFVLAGGGSKGAYECGAIIALNKMGIKADIVCGSSSGSLVGALYCQNELKVAVDMFSKLETDELFEVEKDANLFDFAKAFIFNNGADPKGLKDGIRKYIDEKKIRNSKVDFGLVTVEIPRIKAHRLWKDEIPRGKMQDYVLASASAFPMIKYHVIDGKKFIDGAYLDVMPVKMAIDRGADIVYAIDLLGNGIERKWDRKRKAKVLIISSKWELGFPLDFDSDRQRSMLKMGFLDAKKALGLYEGDYFCFEEGTFKDKDELFGADCCARFFNLNPAKVYTSRNLLPALKNAIKSFSKNGDFDEKNALDTLSTIFKSKSIDAVGNDGGYGSIVLAMATSMIRNGKDSIMYSDAIGDIFDETYAAAKYIVDNKLYKPGKKHSIVYRGVKQFIGHSLSSFNLKALRDYMTGRYFVYKIKSFFHR